MSEHYTRNELQGRMQLAAQAYAHWSNEDLWDEFCTCTEQGHLEEDPTQREIEFANREAIGIALVERGVTIGQLSDIFTNPFGKAAS